MRHKPYNVPLTKRELHGCLFLFQSKVGFSLFCGAFLSIFHPFGNFLSSTGLEGSLIKSEDTRGSWAPLSAVDER